MDLLPLNVLVCTNVHHVYALVELAMALEGMVDVLVLPFITMGTIVVP